MKNKFVDYLILSLILTLLLACGGEKPNKEDILGHWIGDDGAELILKEDDTFIANSLPAGLFFDPIEDYSGKTFSGKGKWSIGKTQTFWEVYLSFEETSNQHRNYGHSILISGEKTGS